MTLLNRLRGFATKALGFTGNVIKRLGNTGGPVSRALDFARKAYTGANDAVDGKIGKAIESLPVVGGIAKFVGENVLNRDNIEGVGKLGGKMQRVGDDVANIPVT